MKVAYRARNDCYYSCDKPNLFTRETGTHTIENPANLFFVALTLQSCAFTSPSNYISCFLPISIFFPASYSIP